MITLKNEESKFLNEFKNPFNSEKIERVFFVVRKDLFDENKIIYRSTIYFKNGNTKGEQEVDAKDFIELIKKTENFIKTL